MNFATFANVAVAVDRCRSNTRLPTFPIRQQAEQHTGLISLAQCLAVAFKNSCAAGHHVCGGTGCLEQHDTSVDTAGFLGQMISLGKTALVAMSPAAFAEVSKAEMQKTAWARKPMRKSTTKPTSKPTQKSSPKLMVQQKRLCCKRCCKLTKWTPDAGVDWVVKEVETSHHVIDELLSGQTLTLTAISAADTDVSEPEPDGANAYFLNSLVCAGDDKCNFERVDHASTYKQSFEQGACGVSGDHG